MCDFCGLFSAHWVSFQDGTLFRSNCPNFVNNPGFGVGLHPLDTHLNIIIVGLKRGPKTGSWTSYPGRSHSFNPVSIDLKWPKNMTILITSSDYHCTKIVVSFCLFVNHDVEGKFAIIKFKMVLSPIPFDDKAPDHVTCVTLPVISLLSAKRQPELKCFL